MLSSTLDGAVLCAPYRGKSAMARKAKAYRQSAAQLRQNGEQAAARLHSELATVHRHLALGRRLLSVNKAMELGGAKPSGYPTLAIANAMARWCWFVRDAGQICDEDGKWNHPSSAFVSDYAVHPGSPQNNSWKYARRNSTFRFVSRHFPVRMSEEHIVARIPTIPPELVPSGPLGSYCILWEADWKAAPKDPLLLWRITREWYSIEAEWNLTSVERLVIEMAAYAAE